MKIDMQIDGVDEKENVPGQIEKIFGSLEKNTKNFGDSLSRARIRVMKGSRWGYRVIFDMKLPGRTIFAKGKGANLIKLASEVREQARRQIEKYKDKLSRR